VIASPVDTPKVKALRRNPKVAVTIDDTDQGGFVARVLLARGTASVEVVDGLVPEYVQAAHRWFGEEGGRGWVENMGQLGMTWARVAIRPEWVGIQDFRTRFPNAVERAVEARQAAGGTER